MHTRTLVPTLFFVWTALHPVIPAIANRPVCYPTRFGHHWVSSHPFPIMGLVQSPQAFDVKTYREAGLNTLLDKHRPDTRFKKLQLLGGLGQQAGGQAHDETDAT